MNGISFDTWSGEKLRAEMVSLDMKARYLAAAVGMYESTLSLWLSGKRKPPKKHARKVQSIVTRAREVSANAGDVKPDFKSVPYLRELLRKAGNGNPKPIPQESGSAYIREFCQHVRMAPDEFCDAAQLSLKVATAELVSSPTQRWIKATAMAMAHELNGKLFDEYITAFPSRHDALKTLAGAAYARLVAEVGAPKIREYLYAMILTGDLAGAPSDITEN